MPLEWHGDAILAKTRTAQVGGIQETLEAAVGEADNRVHVLSGNLQSKVDVLEPAHETGDGASGQFGVEGVEYAIYQEQGLPSGRPYGYTPYLRPSMDIESRSLGERIKKRFG